MKLDLSKADLTVTSERGVNGPVEAILKKDGHRLTMWFNFHETAPPRSITMAGHIALFAEIERAAESYLKLRGPASCSDVRKALVMAHREGQRQK